MPSVTLLGVRAATLTHNCINAFADPDNKYGLSDVARSYMAGKPWWVVSIAVARWVSEEGLGLDVCSEGELAIALAAGVTAAGTRGPDPTLLLSRIRQSIATVMPAWSGSVQQVSSTVTSLLCTRLAPVGRAIPMWRRRRRR